MDAITTLLAVGLILGGAVIALLKALSDWLEKQSKKNEEHLTKTVTTPVSNTLAEVKGVLSVQREAYQDVIGAKAMLLQDMAQRLDSLSKSLKERDEADRQRDIKIQDLGRLLRTREARIEALEGQVVENDSLKQQLGEAQATILKLEGRVKELETEVKVLRDAPAEVRRREAGL